MKGIKNIIIVAGLLTLNSHSVFGKSLSFGPSVGHWGSTGGTLEISLLDLHKNFPLGFILGAGYFNQSNPGNAEDARKIFINDNTGGVIQEEGNIYIGFFDVTYPIYKTKGFAFRITAGPRYVKHIADFAFLGDNEVFAITSAAYGAGSSIRLDFDLSKYFLLKFSTGYDIFQKTQLGGHGEFYYEPDSTDDNPRGDYTYADADEAIFQPDKYFRILLGVEYRF
ncbi:MAG: hypothetical protein OEZ13_00720 [Spirochaetia bacterium]|nr:hypothetical protein [Spirochaetia bacterium]